MIQKIILPPDIVAKLQKILNSLEDGAQRSPGQWTSSEITSKKSQMTQKKGKPNLVQKVTWLIYLRYL